MEPWDEGDGFQWAKMDVDRMAESGSAAATHPVADDHKARANVGVTKDREQDVWRIKKGPYSFIMLLVFFVIFVFFLFALVDGRRINEAFCRPTLLLLTLASSYATLHTTKPPLPSPLTYHLLVRLSARNELGYLP